MHVPDGFISGPINAGTGIVALATAGIALRVVRKSLDDKHVPLLGMTAAGIFAAQMLNFPILGGASGHVLGASFAALLLGPWAACLVLSLVVTVQCLLCADGGITALGSNIVNMGVVGVFAGWASTRLLRAILPGHRALLAVALGAWCSVMAAAAACALELGCSGAPLAAVLPAMLSVHAVIGLGEALITTAVVSTILAARPDLLPGLAPPPRLAEAML